MSKERYDIFLSHNSADKPLVEEIAEQLLEDEGIRSWLDAWSIPGGTRWRVEIEEALASCETCAVILGGHGWGEYHLRKARTALEHKQQDPGFRVIPVLLPGARAEDRERGGLTFVTNAVQFLQPVQHRYAGVAQW